MKRGRLSIASELEMFIKFREDALKAMLIILKNINKI